MAISDAGDPNESWAQRVNPGLTLPVSHGPAGGVIGGLLTVAVRVPSQFKRLQRFSIKADEFAGRHGVVTIPTYLPYFIAAGTIAVLIAIFYGLSRALTDAHWPAADRTRALRVSAVILLGWLD